MGASVGKTEKQIADFAELNAHDTQEALAEALEAEREESRDEHALEGEVVRLNEDDDNALPENPFMAANALSEHTRMVEALLFAAAEPLDLATIAGRLPEGAEVEKALELLKERYQERGIVLQQLGRKWRFVTAADVSHVLEIEKVVPRKLSRAALETLAIIAYHQPCTRADIEEVRGVQVSKGSLDQLMELGWVRLRGRRDDVPGRPILYGTSQEFLEHFGLESVSHLPGMADLKAAGLLDARLPSDFQVPVPSDSDEDGYGEGGEDDNDFVQDFNAEDSESDAESDLED